MHGDDALAFFVFDALAVVLYCSDVEVPKSFIILFNVIAGHLGQLVDAGTRERSQMNDPILITTVVGSVTIVVRTKDALKLFLIGDPTTCALAGLNGLDLETVQQSWVHSVLTFAKIQKVGSNR